METRATAARRVPREAAAPELLGDVASGGPTHEPRAAGHRCRLFAPFLFAPFLFAAFLFAAFLLAAFLVKSFLVAAFLVKSFPIALCLFASLSFALFLGASLLFAAFLFEPGGFLSGGFLSGGFLSGGFLSGGFLRQPLCFRFGEPACLLFGAALCLGQQIRDLRVQAILRDLPLRDEGLRIALIAHDALELSPLRPLARLGLFLQHGQSPSRRLEALLLGHELILRGDCL